MPYPKKIGGTGVFRGKNGERQISVISFHVSKQMWSETQKPRRKFADLYSMLILQQQVCLWVDKCCVEEGRERRMDFLSDGIK